MRSVTFWSINTEKKKVYSEYEHVDVQVNLSNKTYYYEIKTENTAKGCIRQAIGQLLEYACYPDKVKARKLIVVGEHFATLDDEIYLSHLRKKFRLPVGYCYFDLDKKKIVQEI